MNKIARFVISDLKNIFRDRILTLMFFVPLLFFCILKFAAPILYEYVPVTKDYEWLIVAVVCTMVSIMPAYIFSFIMLDERDEQITEIFKIIPFQLKLVVIYRLAFIGIFSFVSVFLLLMFGPAQSFNFISILFTALLLALNTAVALLIIVAYAKDKIVAVTMCKGLNFFVMIPVVSFIFDIKWLDFIGIIPNYWIFKFIHDTSFHLSYQLSLFIALGFQIILLYIFYRFYLLKSYRS